MQQFYTEGIPAGIIWLYVNHHPSQQLTRIKVLNETCINFHFFQVTLTQNKTTALTIPLKHHIGPKIQDTGTGLCK